MLQKTWIPKAVLFVATIGFLSVGLASTARASQVISIASADFDRWMYPFNGSPGVRQTAPTFSAVGANGFDEFDGQFLVGFDTAGGGVPPLGPNQTYLVHSVKVTVTHATGSFLYDPTFDPYASYLDPADPDFVSDTDAGRPVELYGAGLRGGYTKFGFSGGVTGPPVFNEGSPFAFADPTLPKVRNAYAMDPIWGDVSNVVSDRLFGASPWAIGQVAGLSAGDPVVEGIPGVSAGSTFAFDLDLSRPEILDYVVEGLESGGLLFSVVSLHTTTQAGGSSPNFYTSNSFDPAAIAPTLTIDLEIVPVPEPATWTLGLAGGFVFAALASRHRPRKRRFHFRLRSGSRR